MEDGTVVLVGATTRTLVRAQRRAAVARARAGVQAARCDAIEQLLARAEEIEAASCRSMPRPAPRSRAWRTATAARR
jgi:hypothetical protein